MAYNTSIRDLQVTPRLHDAMCEVDSDDDVTGEVMVNTARADAASVATVEKAVKCQEYDTANFECKSPICG